VADDPWQTVSCWHTITGMLETWKQRAEVGGIGLMLASAVVPAVGLAMPYWLQVGAFLLGWSTLVGVFAYERADTIDLRRFRERAIRLGYALFAALVLIGIFVSAVHRHRPNGLGQSVDHTTLASLIYVDGDASR
jgi:hypothetical protein